jgi:hypothetical protein
MLTREPPQQLHSTSSTFSRDGYATIEGFLDDTLLARLQEHVERALQAPVEPGCERPNNRLVSLGWNDPIVDLILSQADAIDALASLIAATDLRWISGYLSIKEPHSQALWWHQDWWCWDHPVSLRPEAPQVALLCYLSDTSEQNGALRVLPGSHHASLALHEVLPRAHAEGEQLSPEHTVFADQPGQVTLHARAGDAVVIDYRLLHSAHANLSAERRDCVLLSFTPSWRDLPVDVRAHLIQHLALPAAHDRGADALSWAKLLPDFAGVRADLELNRTTPPRFAISHP